MWHGLLGLHKSVSKSMIAPCNGFPWGPRYSLALRYHYEERERSGNERGETVV